MEPPNDPDRLRCGRGPPGCGHRAVHHAAESTGLDAGESIGLGEPPGKRMAPRRRKGRCGSQDQPRESRCQGRRERHVQPRHALRHGQGVAQDYAKALEWYEKAADKGNADAMNNIGTLYYNRRGVEQDYAKAREWYEKAAAKDNVVAMYNLGRIYENGQGVAQDYAKARELYEKAADKGKTRLR